MQPATTFHESGREMEMVKSPGWLIAAQDYIDLVMEYRMALRVWSETRAVYGTGGCPEVILATRQLEELERGLKTKPRAFVQIDATRFKREQSECRGVRPDDVRRRKSRLASR